MAAAATPPGVVDPTKPSKYPVILSDALLGKSPKEILTAIKYNHKPTLSSDTAPSSAKIKPSTTSTSSSSSADGSYDLSFTDDGGKYAYAGNRSSKENQYVLLFDPERKAFVLHRLDSTLNMNLTRTPSNTDPDALKDEFPHLESSSNSSGPRASADGRKQKPGGGGGGGGGKGSGKGKGKAAAKNAGMVESKRSGAPPAKTKANEPAAKKEEKPKRSRSPVDSEEDESDDDDGLLVEYPDPQPAAASAHSSFHRPQQQQQQQQQPSELGLRRFSSFKEDDSDEDADAEYDEDDLLVDEGGDSSAGDGFKLPSPVGRSGPQKAAQDEDADADMEPEVDDLEALLEQELEGEGGAMDVDSESSVSEED